ncbi:MAG TPA: hypothetical protein VGN85_11655 [Methyloceanibacter sp.]|jgi:hypothetical protein|nr:hypothetical protein [Methyloceanibacter sp.]
MSVSMPTVVIMLFPTQYAWFEPVLIAAIVVFVVDLIGSVIVFSRRPLLNALASAILFAALFGVLVYYGYGSVQVSITTTPAPTAPAQSPQ